jgi:hypothetical protein
MKSKTGLWLITVFAALCLLSVALYLFGHFGGRSDGTVTTEEQLQLEKELSVLQYRLEEQTGLSDSLAVEVRRYMKQNEEIREKMEALRAYHDSVVVAVYLFDANSTVRRLREWLSEDCSHRE